MGLIRNLAACLLATALGAAELRFEQESIYKYELVQDVTWRSGGDELAYRTAMIWELLVLPRGTDEAGRLRLLAIVTQIDARHYGPGSEHRLHAGGREPTSGADDPLLGNLVALLDVPLTLTVEPATGEVVAVEGHQAIVDRLVERHPGRAGGASPIAEQAAAAYAPERLARLWSTLLTVPRSGRERIPLEAPLAGEALRSWEGERYTLSLPKDAAPEALLHTSPGRVALELTSLSGSGSVTLSPQGVLRGAEGTLEAAFDGSAMTQDLSQHHRIRWTLARREPQPAAQAPADDASPPDDGTGEAGGDSP